MVNSFSRTLTIAAGGVLILLIFTGCVSKKIRYSEAEADLDLLKQKIEEIHPNPWWHLSEQQFDSLLVEVKSGFSKEDKISQKEFYQGLNPVIAQLNDGHTRLVVPSAVATKSFLWGSKILPVAVDIQGTDVFLLADLKKGIIFEERYRVTRINGIPITDIMDVLISNKYGYNQSFRMSQISETAFTRELWLYLDMNKHFEVEVESQEGKTRLFTFKGMFQPGYYRKNTRVRQVETPGTGISRQIEHESGYYQEFVPKQLAVVKYPHFGRMEDRVFLDSAFNLAKTNNIQHLVMDLRGNGGGTTSLYQTIVPHLTSDTVVFFSEAEFKASQDLLDFKPFGKDFPYPETNATGELHLLDPNLLQFSTSQATDVFEGKFYVLMDGGTYSTASGFCAFIQDNQLGTLMGEPSGGMGSSFGNFIRVNLPNSKIPVLISTSRYYRPNGDRGFSPVQPQIEIDCFGKDTEAVYEKVLEAIVRTIL